MTDDDEPAPDPGQPGGRPAFVLRPQRPEDLALLVGDSPFNDFGPVAPRTRPAAHRLEEDGGLTVVDEQDQVLGDVGWHWQHHRHGPNAASDCVMIGCELRREHRGHGPGGPVQAELVRLLLAHTGVHRVEASTDVDNLAEQRALGKAGFVREGVARGAQWRDGAFHDLVTYAVLRGDPPAAGGVTGPER